jgi:hypothetical protein
MLLNNLKFAQGRMSFFIVHFAAHFAAPPELGRSGWSQHSLRPSVAGFGKGGVELSGSIPMLTWCVSLYFIW